MAAGLDIDQKPTLKELQNVVVPYAAPKWEDLGVQLDLDEDGQLLDSIEEKRGGDEAKCCLGVVKKWLQGAGVKPKTWRTLMNCLREIGAQEAIESIQENILKGSTASDLSQQQSTTPPTPPPQQIDYSLRLEPPKQIRNYQRELAEPGINGENYIFCAPTGTGKTLVAGLVISNHLQERKEKGKVIFLATTRPLAEQQAKKLQMMIPASHVECCTGDNIGVTLQALLPEMNIIVCTPGKLLDELKQGKMHLEDITLLVIDECHHTRKNAPQAQVMMRYLKLKQEGGAGPLPQVVGLTASPGAGDNKDLEMRAITDHLTTLCALMDATYGIKTVTKNLQELERYTNKPTFTLKILKRRDPREEFISCVTKEMAQVEQLVDVKFFLSRWSHEYEGVIQKRKQDLELSLDTSNRDKISVLELLRCYSQSLNIYMDLRREDAISVLNEFTGLPSDEKLATPLEWKLAQSLKLLKTKLACLPEVQNPLLRDTEEILRKRFSEKPDSKGIFFVRTKKHASAICSWISNLSANLQIRPCIITGHTRDTGTGMTQADQENVVQGFKDGEFNLLVATSVAEEGLDIPACNLVIRFQHVSDEIAKVQVLGRARAEDSEGFTILSSDSKKPCKEMLNSELEALVNVAVLYTPAGKFLLEVIIPKQQEIYQEQTLTERLANLQLTPKDSASMIKLKCKKCKVLACSGSDVYTVEGQKHYVVADEYFKQNKIIIKQHHTPKLLSEEMFKRYKIYCAKCEADWGVMCIWSSSGYELPVLKCKSFIFERDGFPLWVKKWSMAPFEIPPLSSRPEYQTIY